MPWIYDQRTGRMIGPNGEEFHGYSGSLGIHQNNPDSEHIRDHGPIPRGHWTIDPTGRTSARTGQFSITVTPRGDTNTFGRDRTSFRIHGDSTQSPGGASSGCIILNRAQREAISRSGDTQLIVR